MDYSEQIEKRNKDSSQCKENEPLTWMFWKKRRYIVAIMAFFAYFMNYALRINLSVAIVAMTENRTELHGNGSISHQQDFEWDSKQKGFLLSTFFFGYILTQGIGGYLGARYGGNHIIGTGIGGASLLTLLTPIVAKYSFWAFCLLRVGEGFLMGGTFPSIVAVWSRWAPPLERSRMASLSSSGIHIGILVTMLGSGFLASRYGWESIFYVFGSLGVLWYTAWTIVVKAGPEEDPFCSEDEKLYIQSQLNTKDRQDIKRPWKAILTSAPVYAIVISTFCDEWGASTLLTQFPTFLREVLHFDLQNTGLLSAAPYLMMALMLGPAGIFADWFQIKGYLTTTHVRKTFNGMSNLNKVIFMICAAQFANSKWSVLCISLARGLGVIGLGGTGPNPLDIAPQHASIILGISNTFGTIPGIICPYLTGVVVHEKGVNNWSMVFYMIAGIHLLGMVIYGTLASGDLQEWAKDSSTTNEKCEKPREKFTIILESA